MIIEYNKSGIFAGYIEISATVNLYNLKIIILINGNEGYNIYNNNFNNTSTIYII